MTAVNKTGKRKYIGYLVYLIPIAIILLGYGLVIVATNEPEPFTIVSGPSMQPTILPGSIAMISKTPFDQLKIGEIIVFTPLVALDNPSACQSGAPPTLASDAPVPCFVIHRIISITTNNQGQKIVTTSGDNNGPNPSPCLPSAPRSIQDVDCNIDASMYVGQVVLQFPIAGYVTQYPYNFSLVALILIALLIEIYFEHAQARKLKQNQVSKTTTN